MSSFVIVPIGFQTTTVGQAIESERARRGNQCPSRELTDLVIQALYDGKKETLVRVALDVPDITTRLFTLYERWGRRYDRSSIAEAVRFVIQSFGTSAGFGNIDDVRGSYTVSAEQMICSTRRIAPSLCPKDGLDFKRLFASLSAIAIEHHLLRRLGTLLKIEKTKQGIRHELLAMGSVCSSIPDQSLETQIPDYPKEIPWPILFLRCKLSYLINHGDTNANEPERVRDLVNRIIRGKQRFPRYVDDLQRLLLETQLLEASSLLAGRWTSIVQTMEELSGEKKGAGPLVEWPVALTVLIDKFQGWKKAADDLAREAKEIFAHSSSAEQKAALSDRWETLLNEFESIYSETLEHYKRRENQAITGEVYRYNYEKLDTYLKDLHHKKTKSSIARRGCGVAEFNLNTAQYTFFNTTLKYPRPEALFADDLPQLSEDRSFLASEKERVDQEALPSKHSNNEFLPEYLRKPVPKQPSPKPHKKGKHPRKEPTAPVSGEEPQHILEEKRLSSTPCAKAKASPIPAPEPSSNPIIRIGDGPANYQYAWSVQRWTFANPFESDPVYCEKNLSPQRRQEILFEHNFGHVVHKLCRLFGAQFQNKEVGVITYVLPGEVQWDNGDYEKVVFEICYNPKTKKVFHAFATIKSPLQLIARYAERQAFRSEETEQALHLEEQPGQSESSSLPDDGSRITDFSLEGEEDFFQVRDPKYQATLTLYQFPL